MTSNVTREKVQHSRVFAKNSHACLPASCDIRPWDLEINNYDCHIRGNRNNIVLNENRQNKMIKLGIYLFAE